MLGGFLNVLGNEKSKYKIDEIIVLLICHLSPATCHPPPLEKCCRIFSALPVTVNVLYNFRLIFWRDS